MEKELVLSDKSEAKVTEKEVRAMVSLLGDRSLRIRNRVAVSLEKNLNEFAPLLEDLRDQADDPLIRERLTLLILLGANTNPSDHWRILLDNMAFSLRDGMAAISLMDSEEQVTRLELLEQINNLSDEWMETLTPSMTQEDKVNSLMDFLFVSGRFKGNSEDYYSLDNCYLHRILKKGKGLPVTLCLIAVMLAEEASLPLYGIGLPLHFIAGHFRGSNGICFYDCFDSGREVTPEECVNYLHSRGIFFHPQLLSPCDNDAILQRVLVNIKHIAQRKGLHNQLESIEELYKVENPEIY
ncbi:MAG: transglutaminase family protein [Planctomycetes bacterium]|nr:transglutaminase family protein [Planctomycetota bacterium]